MLTSAAGIRTEGRKSLSGSEPIRKIVPEGEYVYPLLQSMGKPAIPIVRDGERVRKGQRIASADGTFSAHIHASVSGRILAVENRNDETGRSVPCIVLLSDGIDEELELPDPKKLSQITRKEFLGWIYNSGVVGTGGQGIPAAYKLNGAFRKRIDYIILDGVESETYLTSDYRMMKDDPEKIISGACMLLQFFPEAKAIIAVSRKNPDLYKDFRALTGGIPRLLVKYVDGKHPDGEEKILVNSLTGRKIMQDTLPVDAGCVVLSIGTLYAIEEAVLFHVPQIMRILTVTGEAVRYPGNYAVPIGASVFSILEQAGLHAGRNLILDGGTLTGNRVLDINSPVTKQTRGFTVLNEKNAFSLKTSPCIRCGKCIEVCPSGLDPHNLIHCVSRYMAVGDTDSIERARPRIRAQKQKQMAAESFMLYGGMNCMNCSCCSYICPSGIRLGNGIFALKTELEKNSARKEC